MHARVARTQQSPEETDTHAYVVSRCLAAHDGQPPTPIDIDRKGRSNVVTVRLDFKPGDTTGWHSHPGPVLVQVVSGAVTLRHAARGHCQSDVVRAGHGFFETPGAVHIADNPGPNPAVLYATFVLRPGAPPEVSAPTPAPCH